jgi:hypothetical protein
MLHYMLIADAWYQAANAAAIGYLQGAHPLIAHAKPQIRSNSFQRSRAPTLYQ